MIKLCIGYNEEQMEPNHQPSVKIGSILEERYDLYSAFVSTYEAHIAKLIEKDAAWFIENPRPVGEQINTSSTQEMEMMFKRFLDSRLAESKAVSKSDKFPVPTLASMGGKSSRFKNGKTSFNKNHTLFEGMSLRPSFVDSGTISDTVKVWYEE